VGKVSRMGPVQVTEVDEKPGALLVRWEEVWYLCLYSSSWSVLQECCILNRLMWNETWISLHLPGIHVVTVLNFANMVSFKDVLHVFRFGMCDSASRFYFVPVTNQYDLYSDG
jgi:hypothetical protein